MEDNHDIRLNFMELPLDVEMEDVIPKHLHSVMKPSWTCEACRSSHTCA